MLRESVRPRRQNGVVTAELRRWLAPTATGPATASVRLPGSKSMTARALILAALADGPSVIERPLRARDTELMSAGLRALGVAVDTGSADSLAGRRSGLDDSAERWRVE